LIKLPCDHKPKRESPKLRERILHSKKIWEARLAWAVEGCLAWQGLKTRKLKPPECVEAAMIEQREDSSPVSEFVQIFLDPSPGEMLPVGDIWQVYCKWTEEAHFKNTFGRQSALMSAIQSQDKFSEIHNNKNKVERVETIKAWKTREMDAKNQVIDGPARVRVGLKWSKQGWKWIEDHLGEF